MADIRLETDLVETKQYIVVQIGNEKYGIDINYIDNIVRMSKITRVPKVQSYFKGVMNLRGEIVPVMSIRKKMGLPEDIITDASRIIIIKLEEKGSIGIIVDEVKEVLTLEESCVEKVVNDSKEEKEGFVFAVGKCEGGLVSLLDLNAVALEKE